MNIICYFLYWILVCWQIFSFLYFQGHNILHDPDLHNIFSVSAEFQLDVVMACNLVGTDLNVEISAPAI